MKQTILVAGGTGNLGQRIVKALLEEGAEVRVLVRPGGHPNTRQMLRQRGATVVEANPLLVNEVAAACAGVSCVVSALAGLRDVMIDVQTVLLDAALQAGVPRFIPSDYSLDFTNLREGGNRNLDMRRDFHRYLDTKPIAATTVFTGAFMDLLTGQMPMILWKPRRILCWGNPDQRLDFTTMDDTAAYTARVALDNETPRYLKVAGDQITPRQLVTLVSDLTGDTFRLLRPGGLGLLNVLIGVARTVAPGNDDLYPAWQGMQYMRDMMEGRAHIPVYDNNRYPDMHWTSVRALLAAHIQTTNTGLPA